MCVPCRYQAPSSGVVNVICGGSVSSVEAAAVGAIGAPAVARATIRNMMSASRDMCAEPPQEHDAPQTPNVNADAPTIAARSASCNPSSERSRRPLLLVLSVFCVAVATAGCSSGGSHKALPSDPPTIRPWASIGAASLRMTRDQIEKTYGHPLRTERIRDYFPVGTKYQGKILERSDYSVRQGLLRVSYVDGRAKVLETTSPRYQTPDGI